MKMASLFRLLTGLFVTGLVHSCTKTADDFNSQGGNLPTHYIDINNNSFSPVTLTIASGGSVTFLNKTTGTHTIVSEDSSTIVSPAIAPGSSYYVLPDTLVGSQPVRVDYHCKEHPSVTGTIVLLP